MTARDNKRGRRTFNKRERERVRENEGEGGLNIL